MLNELKKKQDSEWEECVEFFPNPTPITKIYLNDINSLREKHRQELIDVFQEIIMNQKIDARGSAYKKEYNNALDELFNSLLPKIKHYDRNNDSI